MNPMVSFVVPCYKLAHLLRECVESILAQTYTDFEVLIMDDCSPDNTPEVAQSFKDPRVKHIRNEPNLGHLRNYNKGIELARGKYIWLISADDRLRVPYILERYVRFMEEHPRVGYVFCPAMNLEGGQETRVVLSLGSQDAVWNGKQFLYRLFSGNLVVAASGMARKECYEKVDYFPLDMPFGGDWYLWSVFALHYDVAYMAEPMVSYRIHELCITDKLLNQNSRICVDDDLRVLWQVKKKIEGVGDRVMAEKCRRAIAYEYARQLVGKRYRSRELHMTQQACEESLRNFTASKMEADSLRPLIYGSAGDIYFQQGNFLSAQKFYRLAVRERFWSAKVWAKLFLLKTGHAGTLIRKRLFALNSGS